MFFMWRKPDQPQQGPSNYASNVGGKELPFSISAEPIEGFRTWRVRNGGKGLALHSLMQSYIWEVENDAACLPSSYHPGWHRDPAPSPGCACGIYAQLPDQPITEWETHVRGRVRATGSIAMSGRILRCERGDKAGHATLLSPIVVDVNCAGDGGSCEQPVTRIQLPGPSMDHWGYCDVHDADESPVSRVLVDAQTFMGEAVRQLSRRYEGVEFLTFMDLGGV